MFGSKARKIKQLEAELEEIREIMHYYEKRFIEVSQRLQGRDSKGRFLPKLTFVKGHPAIDSNSISKSGTNWTGAQSKTEPWSIT